jgi:hypothetical protein
VKNIDSSENNENERERENEKKKKPRARAKQKKKGLSAAKEKRRERSFFLSFTRNEDSRTTLERQRKSRERKTFRTMTFGTDEYCRAIEFSAAREPLLKMECATMSMRGWVVLFWRRADKKNGREMFRNKK